MPSSKPAQQPIVQANISTLLKELAELGQQSRPVEYQRPDQHAGVIIKGK